MVYSLLFFPRRLLILFVFGTHTSYIILFFWKKTYRIVKKLGNGSYGEVYLGVGSDSGEKVMVLLLLLGVVGKPFCCSRWNYRYVLT